MNFHPNCLTHFVGRKCVCLSIGLNGPINVKQRLEYRSSSCYIYILLYNIYIYNSCGFHIAAIINYSGFYRYFNYFLLCVILIFYISNSYKMGTIFNNSLPLSLITRICVFCLRYLESIVGRCGHANRCIKLAVYNAAICFVIYSGYAIGITHI